MNIDNNPLLLNVEVSNNNLPSSDLDNIVNKLDSYGLANGILFVASQTTGDELTSASLVAYNNLIAKGWTVDVPPPAWSRD